MGGEILRTDSRELMCTILEEFGNIDYKFTTNGIDLLDYKDIILKYRPTVTVSLDGTEHMQAKRRKTNVQNSYNKIIEGIRFLVEAGIKTAIATVYTPKFSAKEYKEFFDLLESLGWLHKENVSVTMTMEMDPGIQGCARDKQLEIINGYIALMLEDKRAQKTVRNILLGVGNLEKTLKDKREDGKIDLIRCPANISSGLVFAPDGYVYNCNFIKEKENRVGRFYPSIEVYDGVVKAFEQRNVYTMEECKQCDMALFCKGGCPASAITKYGELQRGFCGVWKDEELLRHVDLVINVEGLFHVARKYTRGNDYV